MNIVSDLMRSGWKPEGLADRVSREWMHHNVWYRCGVTVTDSEDRKHFTIAALCKAVIPAPTTDRSPFLKETARNFGFNSLAIRREDGVPLMTADFSYTERHSHVRRAEEYMGVWFVIETTLIEGMQEVVELYQHLEHRGRYGNPYQFIYDARSRAQNDSRAFLSGEETEPVQQTVAMAWKRG